MNKLICFFTEPNVLHSFLYFKGLSRNVKHNMNNKVIQKRVKFISPEIPRPIKDRHAYFSSRKPHSPMSARDFEFCPGMRSCESTLYCSSFWSTFWSTFGHHNSIWHKTKLENKTNESIDTQMNNSRPGYSRLKAIYFEFLVVSILL